MTQTIIKALSLACIALLGAACAAIFASSSAASIGAQLAIQAGETQSANVQTALLNRGEQIITRNWARPAQWHAGASEALSAIYFMRGQARRSAGDMRQSARDFMQSAHWAARTVTLADIEPNAWVRLAALAAEGYPNPICEAASCLRRSWDAGRMLKPEAACARVQLAVRIGVLNAPDSRLDDYLRSGVTRRTAATCLAAVFPSDVVFTLAMRAAPPP